MSLPDTPAPRISDLARSRGPGGVEASGAPETKQIDVDVDVPEISAPAVPGTEG